MQISVIFFETRWNGLLKSQIWTFYPKMLKCFWPRPKLFRKIFKHIKQLKSSMDKKHLQIWLFQIISREMLESDSIHDHWVTILDFNQNWSNFSPSHWIVLLAEMYTSSVGQFMLGSMRSYFSLTIEFGQIRFFARLTLIIWKGNKISNRHRCNVYCQLVKKIDWSN